MFRLYLIGLTMGIADLVPGISGGTVAFMCGIYEELLGAIKTLQFQSLKKTAWPFLLPLGSGIATSLLLFSKVILFLLLNYKDPLFGFFCGLLVASIGMLLVKGRAENKLRKPFHWISMGVGASIAIILTKTPQVSHLEVSSFIGLILAGMLGAGAMLLPGISGSFVLQLLGAYPLVLYALSAPTVPGSLKILCAMGVGISLGFIVFSRFITLIFSWFPQITLSLLIGFMGGGIKALWPFSAGKFFIPILCFFIGFSLVIYLEIRAKRMNKRSRVSSNLHIR